MTIAPPNIDRFLDLLHQHLARFYHEDAGERLESVDVLGTKSRSFSTIFFVTAHTSGGQYHLVVKQPCHHPANTEIVTEPNQAVREFDILQRLHPGFAEMQNCSVPRPVLVIPETDTLVMEFVEGHLLADEMRYIHHFASRAGFQRLQHRFLDCGRWLRGFQHQMDTRCAGQDAVERVIDRCELELRRIHHLPWGYSLSRLQYTVRERIDRLLGALAGERIPLGPWHSDFGPWNILANQDGITVFDFYGCVEAPVILDVIKMLGFLEMQKFHVLNNPWRIAQLQARFLDGYGPLPELSPAVVSLCEIMHRLNYVWGVTTYRRLGVFRDLRRRVVLHANLRWLLKETHHSLLQAGRSFPHRFQEPSR